MKNVKDKKNIKKLFVLLFFVLLWLIINSCKPALGASWYPRNFLDDENRLYITEISVHNNPVSPFLTEQPADEADKLKKFVEARQYFVNVPPAIGEILPENIKVKAVGSLSKMEEVAVSIEINGDGVPLVEGKAIPVTIKIRDTQGKYGEVTKVIKITQNEPLELKLESLTIAGENAMKGSVTLPYKKSMISAADIKAEFSYGTQKTVMPIVLEKNSIELKEEESIDVKIFVKALKGQYKAYEKVISITRAKRAEDEDPALEPIEIYVQGIESEIGKEVSVPINAKQITQDDIVVIFKTFDSLPIKLDPNPITFNGSDIVNATMSVPAVKGKYLGWNMKFTVKKNAAVVYNPVDKAGNKKYVVKVNTITEEIDPFTHYGENCEFPASKFDEWIVYISEFNNSNNMASYQFTSGSWSSSPEQYAGPDFGSGLKKMSDVKFYRYKSRKDRWGSAPPLFDEAKEQRFYFYRFTASGGVSLDNSMFCVDTHSKFLFYYSDPNSISNLGVPGGWTDYAYPSSGSHQQFNEPFYLSDPVGYVQEDGKVVLYSWIKQNITNNNYTAQKNPAFTKPAEKKANGAGFSPYRNNIVKKRTEVITAENPEYTLARPLILAQPKALRIKLNAPEEAIMTVKAAPVPEGEKLSYQWYTNTIQSNEGGTPISDAVSASYQPNKGEETNCYVYCAVTNTNTKNGKSETVKSDTVKLLITSGPLTVDAEQPKIIKQPEKKIVLPINTMKSVTLTVEALSMDNGELSYQWYKKSTAGDSEIPNAKDASYSVPIDTSVVKTENYYCVVTNTNEKVDGKKTATKASTDATIVVEESYKVTFAQKGYGTINALYDGKLLKLTPDQDSFDNYVKKGEKVTFFAQAKDGYEVSEWTGVPQSAISENKMSATLTVEKEETVTVTFRKIPDTRKLTITARRIENVDMGGKDYIKKFISGEDVDRAYFIYDFRAKIFETTTDQTNFISIWSRLEGRDLVGSEQVALADLLYKKNQGPNLVNSEEAITKDFESQPNQQYFQLDTKLVKYDRFHFGAWKNQQYLSGYGQSVVEFIYNKLKDEWTCKKADIENNFNIPNVTVSFDESFVLKRGQKKDFTISYYVNNAGNYAVGTAEVTYTLKWE